MAVLVQVAVEYGALASRNAASNSFSDLFERITRAAPTEYVVIGAGTLVVIYLVKKLFYAF